MNKKSMQLTVAAVLMLMLGSTGFGQIVYWTNWTSATAGNAGSAAGTITLQDLSTVQVSYTGDISFANTNGGINYWNYPGTYTNTVIDNLPPDSDIIAFDGGGTQVNTLTFSKALVNPIMAIVSLGQYGYPVQYIFDAPFDVLSVGQGSWGNGSLTKLPGNVLEGKEGHGTIQFIGTFNSISWTCPTTEYWHGFTVAAIPEPATLVLLGLGVALARVARRR
jgi:hypothetical protein